MWAQIKPLTGKMERKSEVRCGWEAVSSKGKDLDGKGGKKSPWSSV